MKMTTVRRKLALGFHSLFLITGLLIPTFLPVARGRVVGWGDPGSTWTNSSPELANAVAISVASVGTHNLALLADGTVRAYGNNEYHQADVPSGLSNVEAVAAGVKHSLVLKAISPCPHSPVSFGYAVSRGKNVMRRPGSSWLTVPDAWLPSALTL